MFWLICFAAILIFNYLWNQSKRNPNEPPELPGSLPLLGHVHLLSGNSKHLWKLFKYASQECQKAGGVLRIRFVRRIIYVVTDPKDCLTLSKACIRKDDTYSFAKPWVGEGLVTAIPDIWKVHRKLLGPVFNQQVLDGFIDFFNCQSRKLLNDLSYNVDQGPFNCSSHTHRIMLETLSYTTLGVSDADEDCINKEYLYLFKHMFKIMTTRFQNYLLHYDFIFNMTPLRKKEENSIKTLHKLTSTILNTRKADYMKWKDSKENDVGMKNEIKLKSFLDYFLELSIEKGVLNDQEIQEELDTLMAAGQDTLTVTFVYTIMLIGSYPQVQETIFAELLRVFGGENRDVTKHDLSQLVYLEAVLKESMRFYTVIPVLARAVDEDVKISQYTLPAGTTCILSPCGMHHHESWGSDTEEFKPERWLDPSSLAKSAGAFAAFSLGRRSCLGKTYSIMLLKIMLAHILQHYKIKSDHTKMVLKLNVVLEPDTGHFIEIESRK